VSAADTERLEAIRAALGYGSGKDAGLNLLGALIDMERNNWAADRVCQETLRRVLGQLKDVSNIVRNSN
jgi:hypothetical protein